MKERPILFSGPMVRAILEGRKTQTRRVLDVERLQARRGTLGRDGWAPGDVSDAAWRASAEAAWCPYGVPGDRLWVRETCALWMSGNPPHGVGLPPDGEGPVYKATEPAWDDMLHDIACAKIAREATQLPVGNWVVRPSIFMPRWASRITLEITDVRVQRLQEITDEDAKAEGVDPVAEVSMWAGYHRRGDGELHHVYCGGDSPPDDLVEPHRVRVRDGRSCRDEFVSLWDSINTSRGFGWNSDPWVWAITFRRVDA